MSPDCFLNENSRYAFVLECADKNIALVHLSDQPEKSLAAELSPLLHGSDVMDATSTQKQYTPSGIVAQMSQRAQELNDKSIEWHHHMLFPDCMFNTHAPNHVLMLEDSSTGEAIISITEYDPIDDLKQIENLYFANVSK